MTIGSIVSLTFLPLWLRLILVGVLLIASTTLYLAMWLGLFGIARSVVRHIFRKGSIFAAFLLRSLFVPPDRFENSKQTSSEKQSSTHQKPEEGSSEQQRQKSVDRQSSKTDDPYSVLGINRRASREEIKRAYRDQMKLYHPDRVQHLGEVLRKTTHEQAVKIQNAYQAVV